MKGWMAVALFPVLYLGADRPARAQEGPVDLGKFKLFVYDADRGLTLRVETGGRVELTVAGDGGEKKTYEAGSLEEFRRRHPEAVRKYGLERYLGGGRRWVPEDFERWWEDFRKNRRFLPEFPDFRDPLGEDWQKWMDEQRRQWEEFRRLFRNPGGPGPEPAPPEAGGRELGIRVAPIPETLRDQLSLREDEGVVVEEVKPGSLAERSGLRKHDLILKVDGKAVEDKWQFRRDVFDALGKKEFDLEIVRGGKRETLKIRPGRKDE